MIISKAYKIFSDYKLNILTIALIEYLIIIFSGTSFSYLHDIPFFNFGADPTYWILFVSKIPILINSSRFIGIMLDSTILLFFIVLILKKGKSRVAIPLFLLVVIFYLTLTAFLGHRNYQTGLIFILIPFLFDADKNRAFAFESIRYFLLFFYFSAAFIKIIDLPALNVSHFSTYLQQQFAPYYIEHNTGWRTTINSFLISHKTISFALYLSAICIELFTLTGFFTKRFDKLIGISLIIFHFSSWLIMDIAPMGQLAFICLLFSNNQLSKTI